MLLRAAEGKNLVSMPFSLLQLAKVYAIMAYRDILHQLEVLLVSIYISDIQSSRLLALDSFGALPLSRPFCLLRKWIYYMAILFLFPFI